MSLKKLLAPLINLFRKPDPPKNWTCVEWIYEDNDEKKYTYSQTMTTSSTKSHQTTAHAECTGNAKTG